MCPSLLLPPARLLPTLAHSAFPAKAAWVLLGNLQVWLERWESYRHLAGPLLILQGAGMELDPRLPQLPKFPWVPPQAPTKCAA